MSPLSNNLPVELAVSAGMFVLTVVVHLTGLMILLKITRLHLTHARTPWLALDRVLVPILFALGLFALHGVEVAAYAVLYHAVGATQTWEQGIYYSTSAYSTAGVGGQTFANRWRVTGGLESLDGMLLIGWSTAFLFQNLYRILTNEEDHPLPAGAIAKVSPRSKRSGSGAPNGTNSRDTELMQ
jgi:voltage-gated potassium channel